MLTDIFDIVVFLPLEVVCSFSLVSLQLCLSPFFLFSFLTCPNMADMAMMRYVESLVCYLK